MKEEWDDDTIQWFIAISKAKNGDPSLLASLALQKRPINHHSESLLRRCADGDPTLLPSLSGRDLPLMLAASEHVIAGPHSKAEKDRDLARVARKYGVLPIGNVKSEGDPTEPSTSPDDSQEDADDAQDRHDGTSVRNVLVRGGDWLRLRKIRPLVTKYLRSTLP